MKKNLKMIFFICAFLMVPNLCLASGKILLDDFSTGHLDISKWQYRELAREIIDGKLACKLGNGTGMSTEVLPGKSRADLPFVGSTDIHTIQADITIVDAELDEKASDAKSYATIGGFFYNVNETESLTGDVFAEIDIGNCGNGLEAFWAVTKRLSDDSMQWETLGSGAISLDEPLQKGSPAIVKLAYDGNKSFEFSVNGKTSTFVGLQDKKRGPKSIFNKALRVAINATGGSNTGFISAKFDNVYINNQATVYDDFSSQLIDPTKWTLTEFVRECSNGYLRSNIRGSGSTQASDTAFAERDASYVGAKVRIDSSSQLSSGANGIARIGGYYYNDSKGPGSGQDYNKYIGDVYVQVQLKYDSNGSMSANAIVDRCNDTGQTSFTNIFSHTFATPITLDTFYNLSIEYKDNKLIFTCKGEAVEYPIATPAYTPYGLHRLLRSRVYLDSGETGYMKAIFDDVVTAKESSTSNLTQTQVSQLFVSLFNRASEGNGNAFFQTPGVPEFENMEKTATFILTLQVVKDYFGPSFDNNQAFVELIFKNTLNRVPADGQAVRDGIAYWVGALQQGYSRGAVVASLIEAIYDYGPGGKYYNPGDTATIAAYNQFTNRVAVSNYLADNQWETLSNYETITRFGAVGGLNVTDDAATVISAKAMVDLF